MIPRLPRFAAKKPIVISGYNLTHGGLELFILLRIIEIHDYRSRVRARKKNDTSEKTLCICSRKKETLNNGRENEEVFDKFTHSLSSHSLKVLHKSYSSEKCLSGISHLVSDNRYGCSTENCFEAY